MKRKEKEEKRKEIIAGVLRTDGYEIDENKYLISVWELAREINDRWGTPYFYGRRRGVMRYYPYATPEVWALPDYELWRLVGALNTYLKKQEWAKLKYRAPQNLWYEIDVEAIE